MLAFTHLAILQRSHIAHHQIQHVTGTQYPFRTSHSNTTHTTTAHAYSAPPLAHL